MKTIHSDTHRLHHGQAELIDGMLKPCFEMPARVDMILEEVRSAGLGPVVSPEAFGPAPRARVHTGPYLAFLEGAWARWSALAEACATVGGFAPDALVVSLGVDTFEDDPISAFRLRGDDYRRIGESIASLGLRTLFVMEGGYAVREIGINVVNVLQAFESVG